MQRLQKIIAEAGITSRRKAEEFIVDGRVKVDGKVVTELGTKADVSKNIITVDGRAIRGGGPKVYILLNKPKGYISAVTDPSDRPVVTDLIKKSKQRIFPVGRLDYDGEGVLILTNDGELSHSLMHPKFSVLKRYLVKVRGVPDAKDFHKLERGVFLEDGRTLPAKARFVRETKENSWIEIIVTEGRNRLIKRMCQAVGHPVSKLKRVEFAGIGLKNLKLGEYRQLTDSEVQKLKEVGTVKGSSSGRVK